MQLKTIFWYYLLLPSLPLPLFAFDLVQKISEKKENFESSRVFHFSLAIFYFQHSRSLRQGFPLNKKELKGLKFRV